MTNPVKLIKHANHVVAVSADGTATLIDPATQRWQAYSSQRAAKWWASVRARVEHGFGGQSLASDTTCAIYINLHQPKKEKLHAQTDQWGRGRRRRRSTHTQPCSDCPWRRDSLPGWLGGGTADEFLQYAHTNTQYDCHTTRGAQCAGMAIYRRNVCKRVDPPLFVLPKDKDAVFDTPMAFAAHHNRHQPKKDN